MFKMGRTECIRPATKEAQACCEEYLREENIDNQKFAELIRAAIKRHNQQTKVVKLLFGSSFWIIKDCLGGNGWDRHIFGLRVQHGEQQVPMHEVFGTEVFAGLHDFPISRSRSRYSFFLLSICTTPLFPLANFFIPFLLFFPLLSFWKPIFFFYCKNLRLEKF